MVPTSWQDEALARHGVSREVPCSTLKGETFPDSLPATPKSPPTRRVPPRGWEIDGETVETVSDFIFLGSKITAYGDCSHEIKRRLLLGRKVMSAMQETRVRSLGREDPPEKEMATHLRLLAWRIPWTEKPGSLYSMGSQRAGHDRATKQQRQRVTDGPSARMGTSS